MRTVFFLFVSYGPTAPIRLIRLIRSKKEGPVLRRTALQAADLCVLITWHTSSVGVPGYSWHCPPGSRVLCVTSLTVMVDKTKT